MSTIKHLNSRELAERWGVSEATLQLWRKDGTGPNYLKLGAHVCYRLQDIEKHEQECIYGNKEEKP